MEKNKIKSEFKKPRIVTALDIAAAIGFSFFWILNLVCKCLVGSLS